MQRYDLIIVGTGFASSFFLRRALERSPGLKVLVLEVGERLTHAQWLKWTPKQGPGFVNLSPAKPWFFQRLFGGSSNCWWACTPRMMPADFELRTRYGVGRDWPVRYEDLEVLYGEVEQVMGVSGDSASAPYPRSTPYPLPPHRLTEPDKLLRKAYPNLFVPMPTARASRHAGGRSACCNNGVCTKCPVDAKFTIANGMAGLYGHEGVELVMGANAQRVEMSGGQASGVEFVKEGRWQKASGDLVVLGANAIFNAHIMLRSGLTHPMLGKGLFEQGGVTYRVMLDGLDNFQGSTSITGHGYMLYDGPHRRAQAAALMETWNIPSLRHEPGRWRQVLEVKFVLEDLPQDRNQIRVHAGDEMVPEVVWEGHSAYLEAGRARVEAQVASVLAPLPVESIALKDPQPRTEAHVMGGAVMGDDPALSVVDRHLIHHGARNLVALGCGAYPTAPPANPTLTLSALSLWSAGHLFGSAR